MRLILITALLSLSLYSSGALAKKRRCSCSVISGKLEIDKSSFQITTLENSKEEAVWSIKNHKKLKGLVFFLDSVVDIYARVCRPKDKRGKINISPFKIKNSRNASNIRPFRRCRIKRKA